MKEILKMAAVAAVVVFAMNYFEIGTNTNTKTVQEGRIMGLIETGLSKVLNVGSKTISIGITLKSTNTNYGYLSSDIDGLTSLVNGTGADVTISPNNGSNDESLKGFARFWRNNPMYVTRINLRATASTLPTSVEFRTFDPFTGQYAVQIVDVAANLVSTQYQSGIVTLATNLVLGRNTDIKFNGTVATSSTCAIDLTVSHCASLEEGLRAFIEGE